MSKVVSLSAVRSKRKREAGRPRTVMHDPQSDHDHECCNDLAAATKDLLGNAVSTLFLDRLRRMGFKVVEPYEASLEAIPLRRRQEALGFASYHAGRQVAFATSAYLNETFTVGTCRAALLDGFSVFKTVTMESD